MIQTIKIHGCEFISIQNWIWYNNVWVDRQTFFDYELDMGWWVDEYNEYVSDNNNNNNNNDGDQLTNNSVDQQHG